MIAEELKAKVDTLTPSERQELSSYLTKLELENDPDYWKTIRRRTGFEAETRWVKAEEL